MDKEDFFDALCERDPSNYWCVDCAAHTSAIAGLWSDYVGKMGIAPAVAGWQCMFLALISANAVSGLADHDHNDKEWLSCKHRSWLFRGDSQL